MKFLFQLFLSFFMGVCTFLLVTNILHRGFITSSILSFIAFFIGLKIFAFKKSDDRVKNLQKIHGISPEKLKSIINDGKNKVDELKSSARRISNMDVRDQIRRIIKTIEKIFDDFEKDPKDIKAARQFLNYYLDATMKIIKQYALLSRENRDQNNNESLKKAEETLGTIEIAFEKQLAKLYEDDFLDLDTEISLLEKTLKVDGFHKDS